MIDGAQEPGQSGQREQEPRCDRVELPHMAEAEGPQEGPNVEGA